MGSVNRRWTCHPEPVEGGGGSGRGSGPVEGQPFGAGSGLICNTAATVGLRAGFRVYMALALVAGTSVRWDDLTTGNAAGNLSNGWSLGLEWFRYFDIGNTSRDLGIDFDDF